ncbi:MAG: cadherin-like beta sandwich domain-containing protein [Oscillospiraceae bacterium]|nr:cadherin-like beta sandwich domain-containing protein [Oscillospiraceae bacterium]
MRKLASKSLIASIIILAFVLVMFSGMLISSANVTGGFAVTSSANNLNVGQEFTITVTITAPAPGMSAYQFNLHYDSTRVTFVPGGSNGIISRTWAESTGGNPTQRTETFRFRATAAGTPEFSVGTGYGMVLANNAHTGGGGLSMNRTATNVTIIAAGSNDSTLRALVVPGHSLSPAFNPNTSTYTVNLPFDVTAVAVNAQSNQIEGRHTISAVPNPLPVGTTTVTVRSYAPNGTYRVYTLRFVRAEAGPPPPAGPIEIEIGGENYVVTRDLAGIEIPDGFETKQMELAGEEITAVSGVVRNLTLVHLTDRSGIANFFVYDQGELFPFVVIALPYQNLIVIPNQAPIGNYTNHRYMIVLGQSIRVYYSYVTDTQNDDSNDGGGYDDGVYSDYDSSSNDGGGYDDGVYSDYYSSSNDSESYYLYQLESNIPETVMFYAMNWQGASSWYRFDTVDSTIQRYIPTVLHTSEQPINVVVCYYCDETLESPAVPPNDNLIYARLQANIDNLEGQLRTRNEVTVIIIAVLGIVSILLAVTLGVQYSRKKKTVIDTPTETDDGDDQNQYGYTRPNPPSHNEVDTSIFDSLDTSSFDEIGDE